MKHLHIFLIPILLGLNVYAQSMTLQDFETRFEQELQKIIQGQQQKQAELRQQYLRALLQFDSEAKRNGDLDGVEAVRQEIGRVEQSNDLVPEGQSSHPDIARMQDLVRSTVSGYVQEKNKRVVQLVQTVRGYVESTSSTLVQQDKIQEAVAWRNWGETLEQRPVVAAALEFQNAKQERQHARENAPPDTDSFHPALKGDVQPFQAEKAKQFPRRPRSYVAGSEPDAKDKRLGTAATPSMAGSGMSLLSGRVKLVEEEETLNSSRDSWSSSKHKSHLYVARVEYTPLPGKELGRTLVVFDLYKRGSGSKREVIRTDSLLVPPVKSGQRVVVDAGPYEYESYKYRSSFGYRYDEATAEEFYGYIVSFFDENGELFFQRATEDALKDLAREAPPHQEGGEAQNP